MTRAAGFVTLGLPILFVALLAPRVGTACETVTPDPWVPDPAEAGVDTAAPTQLVAVVGQVKRGTGPQRQGCAVGVSSCDGMGYIGIDVSAVDDRTPLDRIGYELRVVEGTPPDLLGMDLPVTLQPSGGSLDLVWSDDDTDVQEALDFTLEVRAVDLAGNRGEPVQVRVTDPGSGGCQGGPGSGGSLWLLIIATIGAVFASRGLRTGR